MALETYRVLGSMLDLQTFTVDELADGSDVNPHTVRTVVQRYRHALSDPTQDEATAGRPRHRYSLTEEGKKLCEERRLAMASAISGTADQVVDALERAKPSGPSVPDDVVWTLDQLLDPNLPGLPVDDRRAVVRRARSTIEVFSASATQGDPDRQADHQALLHAGALVDSLIELAEFEIHLQESAADDAWPDASPVLDQMAKLAYGRWAEPAFKRVLASPIVRRSARVYSLPECIRMERIGVGSDSDSEIALEESFARYVQYWAETPTMDATAQALHSLRVLGRLTRFVQRNRESLYRFIAGSFGAGGFSVSPRWSHAPTLYACVSAIGVIKAMCPGPVGHRLGLGADTPLVEARPALVDSPFEELYELALDAIDAQLRRSVHDGFFVDSREAKHPTLHSLDLGVSIAWNLGRGPEHYGVEQKAVAEFASECWSEAQCGATGMGFRATRPSDGPADAQPCTGTSALTYRLFKRANWSFPFDVEELIRFFVSMKDESGGVRVFPGQPATTSATQYFVECLWSISRSEDRVGPELARLAGAELDDSAKSLLEFLRGCRVEPGGDSRGYGYAFADGFAPNLHCTRFALRVLRRLNPIPRAQTRESSAAMAEFIESQFDEDVGGFRGYDPSDGMEARAAAIPLESAVDF